MVKFFLSALWSAILSLVGLQRKDPIQEMYKKDAEVAEKQAKVFAAPDRDRATVDDILQRHADQ